MSQITTPRDLFLHELGDILYVERKLVNEVLPKLIGEVQDKEFRTGLERHLEQTRGHITNVEQVFDELGEQAHEEECIGFEGLKKEQEKLVGEASEDLVDLVNTGAAARTEHYGGEDPPRRDQDGDLVASNTTGEGHAPLSRKPN